MDRGTGSIPGGFGGTAVNILVRALLDLGHRVSLVTLDPTVAVGECVTLEGPNFSVDIGPYRPRQRARDLFAVERDVVRRALRARRPDVISAHWTYEFALGAIETGLPTLVTVRDAPSVVFRHNPSPYRLVRWWMHRMAVKKATRLAFNSPYTRAATLGQPESDPGDILPNALPDEMWQFLDKCVSSELGGTLISVNNGFGRLKNVQRLIEAFGYVREELPNARLELVGAGYEPDGQAARWARRRQREGGIVFLGALAHGDTLNRIRLADVMVHPSLEESFGYTLIEAASMGTPVIAGRDSGAVPWVLGGGKFGALVDVRSPKAISAAVLDLLGDPQRWETLRRAAFDSGRDRFSSHRVAAQYVELLKETIGRG
ncbi:MAG: glycosyltransferase family 4 protein [Gemmatimonadota bacterium]